MVGGLQGIPDLPGVKGNLHFVALRRRAALLQRKPDERERTRLMSARALSWSLVLDVARIVTVPGRLGARRQ